jgi:hypothetical protein
MSLSSYLYRMARLSRDAKAIDRFVTTGDPQPLLRRAKNKALGRLLARSGFWRALWR